MVLKLALNTTELTIEENWQNDALQTIESINSEPVDWLIVDHYGLDKNWEPHCVLLSGKFL